MIYSMPEMYLQVFHALIYQLMQLSYGLGLLKKNFEKIRREILFFHAFDYRLHSLIELGKQ